MSRPHPQREIRKTKQNRIADDTLSSSRTLEIRILYSLFMGTCLLVVVVSALPGARWLQNDIDRFFQDRSIVNLVTKKSEPGISCFGFPIFDQQGGFRSSAHEEWVIRSTSSGVVRPCFIFLMALVLSVDMPDLTASFLRSPLATPLSMHCLIRSFTSISS